jgi:hypothetical protein
MGSSLFKKTELHARYNLSDHYISLAMEVINVPKPVTPFSMILYIESGGWWRMCGTTESRWRKSEDGCNTMHTPNVLKLRDQNYFNINSDDNTLHKEQIPDISLKM